MLSNQEKIIADKRYIHLMCSEIDLFAIDQSIIYIWGLFKKYCKF